MIRLGMNTVQQPVHIFFDILFVFLCTPPPKYSASHPTACHGLPTGFPHIHCMRCAPLCIVPPHLPLLILSKSQPECDLPIIPMDYKWTQVTLRLSLHNEKC